MIIYDAYVVQIFDRMNLFIDVFHFNSDHSDLPLLNDIRSNKNQNRFVISENVLARLSVHCFILVAPANEWISNDSQNLSSNWQTWPKIKMRMKLNTIDRRKKENFNLKTKPENALAIFFWQFFFYFVVCLFASYNFLVLSIWAFYYIYIDLSQSVCLPIPYDHLDNVNGVVCFIFSHCNHHCCCLLAEMMMMVCVCVDTSKKAKVNCNWQQWWWSSSMIATI